MSKSEIVQTDEVNNQSESEKKEDFTIEKIEHKPEIKQPEMKGTLPNGVPYELEKVGEIVKEEEVLKEMKKELHDMIEEIKGIDLSEKTINEIVDQVDKSCVEEIIATKMRVEWERVFMNHISELKEQLEKYTDLTVDLEESEIVMLEDKTTDYELILKDQNINECLKKYGDRVIGRGLHARVILEMLVLNDILKSVSEGKSVEEAMSKFDMKEMRQVGIDMKGHETDLKYREGIAYAFLIILESHNIGMKEIKEGESNDDQQTILKKYK